MKQRADRMIVWGFLLTLLLMLLTFILSPVQRFSELENRYLQGIPQFSWDSLLSHQFADDVEDFLSDQFPMREQWVWVKSAAEQLRLQRENNGVYKGKEGYLFEKFAEPDYMKIHRYIEAVNNFAANQEDTEITFMLVPNSIGMYPERLPWMASTYPQSDVHDDLAGLVGERISFLDGFDFLSAYASEQIYYKTDHHWTTRGAYYAYVAYVKQMGWTPLSEEAFEIMTVSDTFLGSYHTKSQFSGAQPDSIEVYKPRETMSTEMYVVDSGERFDTMYDESYLEKKDQYAYFLGGVHALITLTSELEAEAVDLDKLLVIKDSYAHNMLPFLTLHVQDVHVIDIRYYNGSISGYMEEHGIRDVLMLFNTSTFVENNELLKLR